MICPSCGHRSDWLDRDATQRRDGDGLVPGAKVMVYVMLLVLLSGAIWLAHHVGAPV